LKMKKLKILIATFNKGKFREIGNLFAAGPAGFNLVSLADQNISASFPETGRTFLENASGKSIFYSRLAEDVLTVAEDSGLVVDALDNEPGVYSARYAGEHASDPENIRKLGKKMKGEENRKAAFMAVAALSRNGELIRSFEGRVEGMILDAPRGENGFGYDPVFYYPPLGKTFAELTVEEKNHVSHRAQVFRKLREFLIQNKLNFT
jgi:XTP/dITP diphosphohydrolase